MILLFDFDGTLADSMEAWGEKMLHILKKAKVSYPDDIVTTLATLGDHGSAVYMQEVLGVPYSEETLLSMMDVYALPRYRDEILLKSGAAEFLRSRSEEKCVLTASPHKMLDPCLTRNGIMGEFTHVWTCEDLGKVKSDPEIYRDVAARLGVAPAEIVFFDDNLTAIQTAKSAGLQTVAVYEKSGAVFWESLSATADRAIKTWEELL
ncbi:MAG: HAD family phosphatase [Oscillospiraceae bacterium]|nr:HAD family phosphatase [Oscillospiraceae bacterium]